MPNTVRKIGGRWRVVEESTGNLVLNRGGTAVDGGGHASQAAAARQVAAIASSGDRREETALTRGSKVRPRK